MKMETVEHFARIALVTHLLGRQQPLGNEELEKLLAVRSKYQGSKSAAPLPLAVDTTAGSGNHSGRKRASLETGDFEVSRARPAGSRQR